MSRKDALIELLRADLSDMAHAVLESELVIEGLAVESDDRMTEMLKHRAVIKAAIDDLRVLDQVPAGHLFEAIGEIVGALRAVLV